MVAIAAACSGTTSHTGSAKLETLTSVDQFMHAFDDGRGHARLVLLLSPT